MIVHNSKIIKLPTNIPDQLPEPSHLPQLFQYIPSMVYDTNNLSKWQKIKKWWNQNHILQTEISQIKTLVEQKNPHWLDKTVSLTIDLCKNSRNRNYYKAKLLFQNLLSTLPDKQLNSYISLLIKTELLYNKNLEKKTSVEKNILPPNSFINFCFEILSFDSIKKLLKYKQSEYLSLLDDLEEIKKRAGDIALITDRSDLLYNKDKLLATKNTLFITLNNFFNSFWELFIRAYDFSIDEPPPWNRSDAQYKLHTFFKIFEFPIQQIKSFFHLLKNLSPIWWIPYIGTGTLISASLGVIKIFDNWLSKTPVKLKGPYKNLSILAASGKIAPIIGRHAEMQKIAGSLGSCNKNSFGVLFHAKAGVGKSCLLKAFAKEVYDGKYPELKGKQIFEINAEALHIPASHTEGLSFSRIESILSQIKGKEENVILFIDEIHCLASQNGLLKQNLLNNLKTVLESENKIHIIAATTDEGLKKIQQEDTDEGFLRRFEVIKLQELPKQQALFALKNMVLYNNSTSVDDEAIEHAYNLCQKQKASTAVLSRAIKLINKTIGYLQTQVQHGKESDVLNESYDRLERLKQEFKAKNVTSMASKKTDNILHQVKNLTNQIQKCQNIKQTKLDQIQTIEAIRQNTTRLKNIFFNLSHKIKETNLKNPKFQGLAKAFLILGEYVLSSSSSLQNQYEEVLKTNNLNPRVSKALIEKIFYMEHPKQNSRAFFSRIFG